MSKTLKGGLIAATAVIVAAAINYFANVMPTRISINATQTAEARATLSLHTAISTLTPLSTQRGSPTLSRKSTQSQGNFDEPGKGPFNWVAPFEKSFSEGFWAVGRHTYTLTFNCQGGTPSLETQRDFEVSESAAPYLGAVYLRVDGLFIDPLLSFPRIQVINPSQVTIASVSRTHVTQMQAQLALSQCNAYMRWDGSPTEPLKSGKAYQFASNVDPD